MGKRKKKDDSFLSKKTGGKTKQCYHNDIRRWKGTVFPVKLNYKVNHSSKYIKKRFNEFN